MQQIALAMMFGRRNKRVQKLMKTIVVVVVVFANFER